MVIIVAAIAFCLLFLSGAGGIGYYLYTSNQNDSLKSTSTETTSTPQTDTQPVQSSQPVQSAAPQPISQPAPVPQPVPQPAPVPVASQPTPKVARNNTCYGTGDAVCNTCVDVVNSYKKKGWAFDINNFEQCTVSGPSSNKTCYGTGDPTCNTCVDVVNSYKRKRWAFDITKFDQCLN